MDDSRLEPELSGRFRDDPVLGDFVFRFSRLVEPGDADLGVTVERFGEAIGRSKTRARLHVGVMESKGDAMRSWSLELGPDGCSVSAGRPERPDLEVLVGEQTWRQLTEGQVSPLEAFGRGRLRIRGDIRLAAKLVSQLS